MRKYLLLVLILMLAACGSDEEDGNESEANTPTPAPAESTAAPDAATAEPTALATTEVTPEPTSTGVTTNAGVALDDADQLLVWTAPASAPGTHRADQTGTLAYLNNTGVSEYLIDVPAQANRVEPCGVNAMSPDGRYFALFMGLDTQLGGNLYLMTDGQTPVIVEENMQFLGCRGGNSRLQYSPNSTQFGYVAYERDAQSSEFGDGILHIRNTSDLSEVANFENVISFDLAVDGVAFVNFYTDERSLANEAKIFWWDGSTQAEVSTFTAREACRFVSSYTQIAPDGQLWTILGERCRNEGTEWQLYRVDVANQNALLSLAQTAAGAMVSYSEINNLFFTPDNSRMFFTLPDGVANNSVGLHVVSMDDLAAPRELVARNLRVPTYSNTASAAPLLSPDGTKLTFVHSTADAITELHIYDMSNPDAPATVIPVGEAGDGIPFMQYAPDGTLIFLGGDATGGTSTLFRLRPGSTEAEQVAQGTYSGWAALSQDGNKLAVLEWVPKASGVRGETFLNLMVVDLTNGEASQLFQGGEVVDNQTANLQFARPLLWVRE